MPNGVYKLYYNVNQESRAKNQENSISLKNQLKRSKFGHII
jgi:hypothetical protein